MGHMGRMGRGTGRVSWADETTFAAIGRYLVMCGTCRRDPYATWGRDGSTEERGTGLLLKTGQPVSWEPVGPAAIKMRYYEVVGRDAKYQLRPTRRSGLRVGLVRAGLAMATWVDSRRAVGCRIRRR